MTRRVRQQYIYFLRRTDGTGPIKIGCSDHLRVRIQQLEAAYCTKFTVLATAPGNFADERNLHLKFAAINERPTGLRECAYSLGGPTEWFTATPDLLAYVEQVIEAGAIHLASHERREVVFIARWRAGESLRTIGRDYGISRQRVHQIIIATKAALA